MRPAIGAGTTTTASTKITGTAWYDVYEWGGRPGDATLTVPNSVDIALENIRTDILAADVANGNVQIPVTIFFRDSVTTWNVNRPIWLDRPNIEIKGAGRYATTIRGGADNSRPVILLGCQRRPKNSGTVYTLTNDHWVDLYGKLDTTAANAINKKWALRTKTDAHVAFVATPFDHGPLDSNSNPGLWASCTQLTIDFAIDSGVGNPLTPGVLFGIGPGSGEGFSRCGGWYVDCDATYITFHFATALNTYQTVKFPHGGATGLIRVAFQIDLAAATYSAYVNRLQVACTYTGATFTVGSALRFAANEQLAPFQIGAQATNVTNVGNTTAIDRTFCGLCLTFATVYTTPGVGFAPARADGRTVNDLNTYFLNNTNTVFLTLTDGPNDTAYGPYDGRCVTIEAYYVFMMGFFLNNTYHNILAAVDSLSVRDLTVKIGGYGAHWGSAILIGAITQLAINDVSAVGGSHGIGSWFVGAGWVIQIRNIAVSGSVAGYYGRAHGVNIESFQVNAFTRAAFIFCESTVTIKNGIINGAASGADTAIKIYAGDYAADYWFENIVQDTEAGQWPRVYVSCENSIAVPTALRMKNMGMGLLADNGIVAELIDKYYTNANQNSTRGAIFELSGIEIYDYKYRAIVVTDGPLWYGEVKDVQIVATLPNFDHSPMIENAGANGIGRVISTHLEYKAPPRNSAWIRNCHKFDLLGGPVGQFTQLRCAVSGQYGTATPPRFMGLNAIDPDGVCLAAFAVDNTYITATLS